MTDTPHAHYEQKRHATFTAAVAHLDWCAMVPHTIDQIVGIYAEATSHTQRPMRHGLSNEDILATITSREGGGGKGGHSDPTASAALWGEPGETSDDETVRLITEQVTLILEAATELDHLCTDTADEPRWNPKASDPTLTGRIRDAVSRLHHARPYLDVTAQIHPHADWLLSNPVADSAEWLHRKARGIWDQHKGETLQVREQKPIVPCRICGGWRSGTIAVAAGRCSDCSTFFGNHQCERTEAIVRRAEYGKGPTPAQMIEARAAKKAKRAQVS